LRGNVRICINSVSAHLRKLKRFKSPGSAQRLLAVHAATFNVFTHQRHLLRRPHFKELRALSQEGHHLAEALNDEDSGLEAAECLHALIEEIRLVPENGKLRVELYGELAALINTPLQGNGVQRDL